MIGFLKGNVLSIELDSLILDVNGVGYEIFCFKFPSTRDFSKKRLSFSLDIYSGPAGCFGSLWLFLIEGKKTFPFSFESEWHWS